MKQNCLNPILGETTVGELVRDRPGRSRIFENLGIDYCCGGKVPLAEACRARGLDPATVATMLAAVENAPETAGTNPDGLDLAALCDHIERVYHEALREELPRLDFMTRKVAAVHGDHEPRLGEIRRVFEGFSREIAAHLEQEEQEVFPQIRRLSRPPAGSGPDRATLKAALDKLESEHQGAGEALVQFRSLSDGYTPPEWACNTFRALYDGLAQLERQMHEHVHTENNILFPRAFAAA